MQDAQHKDIRLTQRRDPTPAEIKPVVREMLSAFNPQLIELYGKDAYALCSERGLLKVMMLCKGLRPPCFGNYPDLDEKLYEQVLAYGRRYQEDGWSAGWTEPMLTNLNKTARAIWCVCDCEWRTACWTRRYEPQKEIDFRGTKES